MVQGAQLKQIGRRIRGGWARGERVLTICTHKQAARAERKGKHRGKQNVRGRGREGGGGTEGGGRVAEEGTLD